MFFSILFPTREQHEAPRQSAAPACFKDLNLDQIVDPILKEKRAFALAEFFHTPLQDPEVIRYRQDVMRELEDCGLRALFSDFSKTVHGLGQSMNKIRSALTSPDGGYNNYLTRGQLLNCAERYCRAVFTLSEGLSRRKLNSAGLRGFAEYLSAYCASESYTGLYAHVKRLRDAFSTVNYCMLIKNGSIRVRKYEGQADHAQQILRTFAKFRQGDVKDYRHKIMQEPYAAHVEVAVLNRLAELYRDLFADLNTFCAAHLHFDDQTVLRFSREVPFYLSWLAFVAPLRQAGLPFCYPTLCDTAEQLYNFEGFDLALAQMEPGKTVVNDFALNAPERIIVLTGPNQSGKTTFARAFGQLHYLASLGLCVPGRAAALYVFDNLLTHFGREEDLSTLSGKLQDDLVRLRALLDCATRQSILIVNEIFSSTTLSDALSLGGRMMDTFAALGAPVVLVTFLDELASHGPETVSMMSTVHEDDPTERTFKVIRKPPDGLAYAAHLAGRHGLTYEQLCGRLRP